MATGADLPLRRFRRARGLVLVVVLLTGGAATAVAWQSSDDELARRDDAVAAQAADVLDGIVMSVQAGLAGADGIVEPDGTVAVGSFDTYGAGVVAATTLQALAFAPIVTEFERPAFESAVGRPITDRGPGGPSPSPARPVHYPVVSAVPVQDTTRAVLGFDLAGDPTRAAAAERARSTGSVVFSEPVPSQPSGQLSFFVIRAIYRPRLPVATEDDRRAAAVGFVSTAYTAAALEEELASGLPPGARFQVSDGEVVLAQRGHLRGSAPTSTLVVAGRLWELRVGASSGADRSVVYVLAASTALLLAALAYLLQRTARYDRAVDRSARHLEALAGFAGGLATRGSSADVMTYLTGGVLAPLEAFHAAVGVVEGDQLRRYFTPGPLAEATLATLPTTNPLDADTPLTEAARTDEAVLLRSTDAMRERYPRLADAWSAAGFGATANLPLHDRQGSVIGALGVAWDHPVDFDADLRGRLATVAGIAGQTLERAQQGDAEHRLVGALQRDVLVPLPDAEHLAGTARYLPAARSVGMGGDWYEGIVLDDGRYVVIVGDIAGHGITAVGQMAQFRSMLGTLVRIGTPLHEVVERASRSVEGSGRIATAVVAVIDPIVGELHYVAAGHPPPILRLPDGSTTTLDGGRRPLIGVTKASEPAAVHDFPVGATLLCYTDGLIERRGEAIDASVERLLHQVGTLPSGDPDAMADGLLRLSLQEEPTDDVALVVITRRS